MTKSSPIGDRLANLTDRSGACWIWQGGVSSTYGRIRAPYPSRKSLLVHRVAYELEYGAIPEGMSIDHRCHNRLCVKPAHLRAVTAKQNAENRSGAPANNTSGYMGAHKIRGRWRGIVQHNGRNRYAGTHDTPEEAAEAAKQLRLSLFSHNDVDRKAS